MSTSEHNSTALLRGRLEGSILSELLTPASLTLFVMLYENSDYEFSREQTIEAFFQTCFRLGVATKERNTKSQRDAAEQAKVGKQTRAFQEHIATHPELFANPSKMQEVMASYGILPKNVVAAAQQAGKPATPPIPNKVAA